MISTCKAIRIVFLSRPNLQSATTQRDDQGVDSDSLIPFRFDAPGEIVVLTLKK